jgi:hypothetical protein
MKKYFVTVDEYNTVRFYKDEECIILHREDGPAIETSNGYKVYYIEGEPHREDGAAAIYANGDKEYYIKGKLHREDGPAIDYVNGDKCWYLNGKWHRDDGPAVELANGKTEYYINGKHIPQLNNMKIYDKEKLQNYIMLLE